MDRLKMQTKNKVDVNIEAIGKLFPHTITEAVKDYDEKGNPIVTKAIDFDLLKQELSKHIVEGREERYQMNWPGKREAILRANAPINKTLRPCREESVNFDTTENLYIEGDNLEVLKLLQETYLGKIKMIYIDPPYNTGNDTFVYDDGYAMSPEEFSKLSEQYDEDGNMLFDIKKNNEANGRIHTDWLNMMYPRLKLAKDLLSEDGVIFISIDDNEHDNLKKICDEIYGNSNFIARITREAIKGGSVSRNIRNVNDYVLCYAKNIINVRFAGVEVDGITLNLEDENGKYAKGRELNKWGAGSRRADSPSMYYPIKGPNGEEVFPIRNDGSEGRWRLGKKSMNKLLLENNVIFERRDNGTFIVYEKLRDDKPRQKQFTTLFKDEYINSKGTEELKKIFCNERALFDFSKPVKLVLDLMIMALNSDSIILDFFSGSATSAHAVMQLNADDGGNRKYIMVQLPEDTDEKSEAYKAGYKNICEIGKERIRRAGKKIKDANPENSLDLDTGFRVLKLDSTNMKEVYYNPVDYNQSFLDDITTNIKEERSSEDLLFQVMLELGELLSSDIEEINIEGSTVLNVGQGDIVACFDKKVTNSVITKIAKMQPLYAVFRDSSLSSDSVVTNFDEIFKTYSPNTIRKVL